MTVDTTTSKDTYAGNGVTTVFTVNFHILDQTHLAVSLIDDVTGVETPQALTTDYAVTGVGNPTASITMVVAPPTGDTLLILRDVPRTQTKDYVTGDKFPADSHEDGLDKLTMIAQQDDEAASSNLTMNILYTGVPIKVADPVAGATLIWDPTETQLIKGPDAAVIAAAEAEADAAAASAALALSLTEDTAYHNFLINGDFDIWQRTNTFGPDTNQVYTSDRWLKKPSGGTTTVSLQTHSNGQTAVPGNPKFYLRFDMSGADDNAGISQRIEQVNVLSGTLCTVTVYLRHVTNAPTTLNINLVQSFGIGGAPSGDVVTSVVTGITTTTNFTRFTFTVTLPSISGKTIGSSGGDYLELNVFNPSNEIWDCDFSHISIVEGDLTGLSDPFEKRIIPEELSRCQRYYLRGDDHIYQAEVVNTNNYGMTIGFVVVMRAAPSMIFTDRTETNFPSGDPTVGSLTVRSLRVLKTADGTGSGFYKFDFEADAEL